MADFSKAFHFPSFLPRRGPTTPVSPRRHGFGLFRVRSPLLTESLFIFSSYGSSFDGVSSCYAIQAGREIRIMVKPEVVNDERMVLLAREICKKIEDDLDYPGQIKVNIIRESRAIEYAK